MTKQDTIKAAALGMLAAGIATQSEVAELAGVSRQLVRKWAIAAGIDAVGERKAWLEKLWRRANRG